MNKKIMWGLIVGLIVIAGLSISVAAHGMNTIDTSSQNYNYMQGMNGNGMQQMMNTMRGNQYNNGYLFPMNDWFNNMPCHR